MRVEGGRLVRDKGGGKEARMEGGREGGRRRNDIKYCKSLYFCGCIIFATFVFY